MSGRAGLYNEVGFIVRPCALGFSFIATTHLFVPSCPPSHVFILLSLPRAHLHNRPSLNSFCLPSGRRLCVPLVVTGILFELFLAGGSSPLMSLLPTKLLMSWEDIGADHSDVPAIICRLDFDLSLLPLFLLKTPQAP